MKDFDPCPGRDGAQPHIWQSGNGWTAGSSVFLKDGQCTLCGARRGDHVKSNQADNRNREGQ
jgi:hypothetical protein